MNLLRLIAALCLVFSTSTAQAQDSRNLVDQDTVVLQLLDKMTARTSTFDVDVGKTVKFGSLRIKVQSCRKAPPVETPEAASFLQIWEVQTDSEPRWVFSGWMFASSPALSAMDHAVYDVWVVDCKKASSNADSEAIVSEPVPDAPEEISE